MSFEGTQKLVRLAGGAISKTARTGYSRARFANGLRGQALAARAGVRVPRILGRRGLTVREEFVRGTTLDRALRANEGSRKRVRTFARELAALHSIEGLAFGEDLAGAADPFRAVVKARERRILAALPPSTDRNPVRRELARLSRGIEWRSIRPGLTHFDLRPANVLASRAGSVTLIDFESARFYDPLWDLAELELTLWPLQPKLRRDFLAEYFSLRPPRADTHRRFAYYLALIQLRELVSD